MSIENKDYYKGRNATLTVGLLVGVLFPALTLGFELFTQLCASEFLDPIPTLAHVLMVSFVPLSNAYFYWAISNDRYERITLLGWSSAISIGISIVYTAVFFPVMPISALGILMLIGVFGFAPLLTFIATWKMRRYFRFTTKTSSFLFNWRGALVGSVVAIAVIGISESQFFVTRYALDLVSSENVSQQNHGMDILRRFGDERYLIRLSSGNRFAFMRSNKETLYISDRVYSMFFESDSYSNDTVREVFYRSTGKNVGQYKLSGRFATSTSRDDLRQNRELSMVSSNFEGSIDNDASLGYVEWIFEIQNRSEFARAEAVGQIQMPEDSVVSRVTLWIDGEEREAAYAERNKVTEAYEAVVSTNRDPVLVTTSGKDRIDMKCFPVMPKGGKMKVKIGFTFPLMLENRTSGMLHLPYFRSNNFRIDDSQKHGVSVLSTRQLQMADGVAKSESEGRFHLLKYDLKNVDIANAKAPIIAERDPDTNAVWGYYDNTYIKQEIRIATGEKPSRYIFVVDTSEAMKNKKESLIEALKSLDETKKIGLVLTHGNALNQSSAYPESHMGSPSEISEKLSKAEFGGGTDNLPALIKARSLANEIPGGVVIWVHSPQPFIFKGSSDLADKLIRSSNQTHVYNISASNETDEVGNRLGDLNFLRNVARYGDLKNDVNRLVSRLDRSVNKFTYIRTIDTNARETVKKKTSKHMIRLWAFDEVNEILLTEKSEKDAIDLALKYQLVTPVTGAVVLETKEQYDAAGLKPAEKPVVHAVPEPETYLMLLAGILFVFFVVRRTG